MKSPLRLLDDLVFGAFNRLDRAFFGFLKRVWKRLDKLDSRFLHGAGRRHKPRGRICKWLERLDTDVFFDGKTYRTAFGRVRSKDEAKILYFLRACGVRYRYEKRLILEGVKLHPDFYLKKYRVYIECCGMVRASGRYRRTLKRKRQLYMRTSTRVIYLYPDDVKNIQEALPRKFRELTGMDFPEPRERRGPFPQRKRKEAARH